jgi:hypothetical protein
MIQRKIKLFFLLAQKPCLGLDCLITEVSKLHTDTPRSVEPFLTGDRHIAKIFIELMYVFL